MRRLALSNPYRNTGVRLRAPLLRIHFGGDSVPDAAAKSHPLCSSAVSSIWLPISYGRETEKRDFAVDPDELLTRGHHARGVDWELTDRMQHAFVRRLARRHAQKNQFVAGQRARLVEIARLAVSSRHRANADATGERDAERLRAENPLLRKVDQRVVHRVGEF